MDNRVFDRLTSNLPPTLPVTHSAGYPSNGDPVKNIGATEPGAFWFHQVGEEIRSVIEGAGIVASQNDLTQLRQAIAQMIQAGQRAVIIDAAVFNAGVVNGNAVYWDAANNRFDKAIADGTVKQNVVGFASVTGSKVFAFGDAPLFAGLTVGRIYLSAVTAGAITSTVGVVSVGLAKSATEMFVDIDADQSMVGEAASQAAEDALFAAGYKIVVRTDLLPTVPGAPTIGIASAGNGNASVAFIAPANDGRMPITSYTVTSSPGGHTATGTASPINVPGLTNGTAYTFTAHATNAVGSSAESAASNATTPAVVNAQLLLHFDGASNGNVFSDSSAYGRVMTKTGTPVTKTGSPKFGTAYGDMTVAASYLTTPDAPELRFGLADWTIEGWIKQPPIVTPDSHRFLMSKGGAGNLNNAWQLGLLLGGYLNFVTANNVSGIYVNYAHKDDTTNWHHISLNSVGGIVTLYVDGIGVGACTPGAAGIPAIFEGVGPLYVGGWNFTTANTSAPLMDEWIVHTGSALRTGNFTVPMAPF